MKIDSLEDLCSRWASYLLHNLWGPEWPPDQNQYLISSPNFPMDQWMGFKKKEQVFSSVST